jgi:hypothetical protein
VTVLPNPASLAGDDASAAAARYTPQRTRASNEAFKMISKLQIEALKSF